MSYYRPDFLSLIKFLIFHVKARITGYISAYNMYDSSKQLIFLILFLVFAMQFDFILKAGTTQDEVWDVTADKNYVL